MVPADIHMDDETTTPPLLPKTSSNSSTLFKPRSVYTAKPSASVPPQEDKLESVTRKSSSPVSPSQPVLRNKSILDYLVLTTSKDASVQVGQSSAPSEQLKKVAKVTPMTISPPASKPVARVSPHPQNVSPLRQPTLVNTTEDVKANGNLPRNVVKDNWKATSPPAEPRRSVSQESTVPPITPTTTVMSPTCSNVNNVLPTMATSPIPVVTSPTAIRSPKMEHSPVITHSSVPIHSPSPVVSPQVPTFSPQLPMASSMPFNKVHSSAVPSTAVSGTPGTPATDSELIKSEKKKHRKKKRYHSQTEESSQDDSVSEQKIKKKKLKKVRKEQRDSSEERKKKRKAKCSSSSAEGIWVEREILPMQKAAVTAPAKLISPPPQRAPPTNMVSPTVQSIPVIINSKIREPVKEHAQNIPCSKEPKSPKHKTHSKKVLKKKRVRSSEEVENKLRPFLLSYYSSSDSTCSSPTMEELEPVDNKILTPSIDDVFAKEQTMTPGNVVNTSVSQIHAFSL